MSEYQYYEFRAVDHPLTEKQLKEVGGLSSRAEITAVSFKNVYNYGNFGGDPLKMMEKWYDAFVYVSNWGHRRLMLRFPKSAVDPKQLALYAHPECLRLHTTKKHIIIDWDWFPENGWGQWEEGEGRLDGLLPLREEILSGDLRSLYIGWLMCIDFFDIDDDEVEPPLPPGIAQTTSAQTTLINFLHIDPDLVAAAGHADSGAAPKPPDREELAKWIRTIPNKEKDEILLHIMEQNPSNLRWELLKKFHESAPKPVLQKGRRTVEELRQQRDRCEELRKQEEEKQERRREKEEQRRAEAEKKKRLDELAGREEKAWKEVENEIETKKASGYKRAVALLRDLRDLAIRESREEEFREQIRELRQRHSTKRALLERLTVNGLR